MTPSPMPSNPYAPPGSNGNGGQIGDLRERLARIEEREVSQAATNHRLHQGILGLWDHLRLMEQRASHVISEIPRTIEARVTPLERRLDRMEEPWWAPLKPLLWKVYLGIAILVFARIYRLVTGEPLDIMALFALLRGG